MLLHLGLLLHLGPVITLSAFNKCSNHLRDAYFTCRLAKLRHLSLIACHPISTNPPGRLAMPRDSFRVCAAAFFHRSGHTARIPVNTLLSYPFMLSASQIGCLLKPIARPTRKKPPITTRTVALRLQYFLLPKGWFSLPFSTWSCCLFHTNTLTEVFILVIWTVFFRVERLNRERISKNVCDCRID